jgi:PAS domain S-box-containing protein
MSDIPTCDELQNQILELAEKGRKYEATIASLKKEIETNQEKQLSNEERYRALYENAPLPYQSLDDDGCFVDVNPTWLKVLGYSIEEVIGHSYRDFLHPDWQLSFDQNFPAFKRRGYVDDVQYAIRHKDGHFLDIAFRGCVGYNADGSFRQTYCIFDDISERKRTEAALQESEAKLSSIFRSAPIGIGQVTDRVFNFVNDYFSRMLGYEVEELIGQSARMVYPSDEEYERVGNKKYEEIKNKGTGSIETTLQKKNGTLINIIMSSTPVDVGDWNKGVTFSTLDISERKAAEVAAHAAAQKFRLLADYTYDWEYWLSPEGAYLYVSPSCERITGYLADEFIANPQLMFDIVAPDYAEQVCQHYNDERSTSETFASSTFPIRTKTGEQRWIEHHCTPVFNEQGDYAGRRGNNRDITMRRQLETEQGKLLAAIHQTDESIVITDAAASIQYVNPAFESITGYTASEVIGKNPRILQGQQDKATYTQMWNRLTSNQSWQGRFINKRKDGHLFTEEASISPVIDQRGEITHYVGVKKDISEKLVQERQLRQKSKMEAVGVMAGGMAHNFNNNLSIILGNLELIKMRHPTNSEINKRLEHTKTAALRSRDLVRNIMLYSRQGELGEMAPLKLSPLIAETMQLLGPTIPTSISIEQQNSLQNRQDISVVADASQLQECLINLCNNSVHAMDEKGTITISLETEQLSQKDIPLQYDSQPGSYAKLSVTDTGCGMSPEGVERVFDLFYTTKPVNEGTGMGLSTVQGIIKKHSGLIKVQSTEGQGTTFALYLPLIEQGDSSVAKMLNQTVPGGNEQILLVDDDPQVADLVKQMLLSCGYKVFLMTDSREALTFLATNFDHVDLVMTDQTMPKLSGLELITEIKKICPYMPTILCTGYSSKVDAYAAEELSISAFILKPFDMEALLQTVRRVLDEFHNSGVNLAAPT